MASSRGGASPAVPLMTSVPLPILNNVPPAATCAASVPDFFSPWSAEMPIWRTRLYAFPAEFDSSFPCPAFGSAAAFGLAFSRSFE